MKKIILLLPLLISFFFLSCNDSINPYAPFTEEYILNGVIRGDTSYQVVTLSHSYQPDGTNPLSYKEDPAIAGARIELYYNNLVYQFRDSSIARTDTSHFDSPFNFFYLKNLKPEINKLIMIKVFLPNGQLLQSESKTPNVTSYGFFSHFNSNVFPPDSGRLTVIRWNDFGRYAYAPILNINYQLEGDSSLYKIALPQSYNYDGSPEYAKPDRETAISFDTLSVHKTLDILANKYNSRAKIKVLNITIDVMVIDEYLSAYYSSIELGINDFTVRIDDPDYSNIKGGLGVFGSYVKTQFKLRFKNGYLKNLGFN